MNQQPSSKSEYAQLVPRSQSIPIPSIPTPKKTPGFERFSTSPQFVFNSLMTPRASVVDLPTQKLPPSFPQDYSEYQNQQDTLLGDPDWKVEEQKEEREEEEYIAEGGYL